MHDIGTKPINHYSEMESWMKLLCNISVKACFTFLIDYPNSDTCVLATIL